MIIVAKSSQLTDQAKPVLHLQLIAAEHQGVQADKGVSSASVHSLQLQYRPHICKPVAAHDQRPLTKSHLYVGQKTIPFTFYGKQYVTVLPTNRKFTWDRKQYGVLRWDRKMLPC